MASRLLLRPTSTFLTLSLSSAACAQLLLRPRERLLCDSGWFGKKKEEPKSTWSYIKENSTPKQNARGQYEISAGTVKQLSTGSILGVLGGLTLSIFSKPLAILFGLFVFGVQLLENHGIRIIPYNSLQRYAGSINLTSLVHENVPFKLSFGATFALAAFSQF